MGWSRSPALGAADSECRLLLDRLVKTTYWACVFLSANRQKHNTRRWSTSWASRQFWSCISLSARSVLARLYSWKLLMGIHWPDWAFKHMKYWMHAKMEAKTTLLKISSQYACSVVFLLVLSGRQLDSYKESIAHEVVAYIEHQF